MDKYSKNKLVAKRYVLFGVIIMAIIVVLLAVYLIKI